MASLQVLVADNSADAARFIQFPYHLYEHDPFWVAPLKGEETRRWLPAENPTLRSRWVRRFVAVRSGRTVGRIAAVVDPAFWRWVPDSGFFGFFECIEEAEVARALLLAAETALRQRGVQRVLGPVALSTHEEVGFLVDGFDSRPMVLSPYNPPYYSGLVESAGYTGCVDYHAWSWEPHMIGARPASGPEAIPGNLRLRALDMKRWDEENAIIRQLYNDCFDKLWGFVPITPEEYASMAKSFRPFVVPELVRIAEWEGRPVGFALALPDVNEALAPLRGRLWPFGVLRLLWMKSRLRTVRMLLLGVLPEFIGRGIATLLAVDAARAAVKLGIRRGELSLVQSSNSGVQKVITNLGSRPVKTWRLYQRSVDL